MREDLRTKARVAGALWIGCAQFFVAEQVVRLGWRGTQPYSFARNAISDLGATACGAAACSPWHGWMNASFILQGALIAGGAALLWQTGRSRWGLALLVLSGFALVGVGVVPENVARPVHDALAGTYFTSAGLGIAALGVRGRQWLSAVLGVAVVWATVLLAGGSRTGLVHALGMGSVERFAAYGITIWLVICGARLCRAAA